MVSRLHLVTVLFLDCKLTWIYGIHTPALFWKAFQNMCLLAVVIKMPSLSNCFKSVSTHSAEENRYGNCGGSWPVVSLMSSFPTCPIKIISPQNFFISSGVTSDHFSNLGNTFHCRAFWVWHGLDWSVNSCMRLSSINALTTSTKDSGLPIIMFSKSEEMLVAWFLINFAP